MLPDKMPKPIEIDGILPLAQKDNGRTPPAKLLVKDPQGEVHEMPAYNARDMIRHHGWKIISAAKAAKQEAVEDEADEKPDEEALDAEDQKNVEAMDRLKAYRDEITRLGGHVKGNWGVKRLTEEIEKLGGNVPE